MTQESTYCKVGTMPCMLDKVCSVMDGGTDGVSFTSGLPSSFEPFEDVESMPLLWVGRERGFCCGRLCGVDFA